MIRTIHFRLALLLVLIAQMPVCSQTQKASGLFGSKRRSVGISNYYIKLNTQDGLTSLCGIIEWKVDSLIGREPSPAVRKTLSNLKYQLIVVMANTTLHTDPVVGALDTWALLQQLVQYFSEERSDTLYHWHNREIRRTLEKFEDGYDLWLSPYISDQVRQELQEFSRRFPIQNERFIRRSVVPSMSAWISEDELRLKSSVLTMADLMRDLSYRMNFYAEMVPKQTLWQVEGAISGFMPKDTLSKLVTSTNEVMNATVQLMENVEALVGYNRDTILSQLDYLRIESFNAIRQERIAAFESVANEREVVLKTLQQERMALENFFTRERIAALEEVDRMGRDLLAESIPVGKELIDYIFFRVLFALTVIGFFILGGIFLYRRRSSPV